MAPRARSRSSDVARSGAAGPHARRPADPVLRLQRMAGNRATAQVLARQPATKDYGTVRIPKLPAIKITGGNAGDWAAKKNPDTLEVTSEKGRHSAELERLAKERTRIPSLRVTTPMVDQSGQHLDYGSVEIEFVNARITGYAVDGKTETWRAVDFEAVHRTTVSHKTGV
ncbi:hypothetical protein FSW04_19565 [Baekduia soli]|uniref:Uncharacterized protein n=1 Tax=Baekduia soli TaxID=496014 RepID=A0A5B8UAB8_9ACTN|nr:hypothetical protein [Baekduia soli]QEC49551.1 hypothetical protein FSW04_19565 [Baekduia soli]